MKFVLIITLFLVIFDGIKSHAWQTQSQIGNNNAFQSGMSRFNSANSQQSDLLSENSGYTMVINLPTLLKALKKSSLQHNQLQQKSGKQQRLTQQQNSWPVHTSQQQPSQQLSQHPQSPQTQSQFTLSQPMMAMQYPADTQPKPSQQQPSQQLSQHPQGPQLQSQFSPSQPMMAMQYPADTQPMASQQQKSWPVHPSLQQPPQQLSQQPQNPQPQSQFPSSRPMMVMQYPAMSIPSQQSENTTVEETDENSGSDIESQLKVCEIFLIFTLKKEEQLLQTVLHAFF